MLNVLKVNEISFGIDIEDESKVIKLSCNHFKCPVNEFVKMKFVIYNNQGKFYILIFLNIYIIN